MTKQDELKSRELAIKSTRDIDDKGNEVYNAFVEAALQEIAQWKEEQMIQKAKLWLSDLYEKSSIRMCTGAFYEKDNLLESIERALKDE